MARRRAGTAWTTVTASWPRNWGRSGPIIRGGQISTAEAAAVLADLAERGTLAVELQLRHGAAETWLNEARQYRIEELGYHVLDLAGGFSEVWTHKFRGTARTAVRKAERSGLEVDVDRTGQLLPVFYDLYEKSIRRWSARQHEPLRLTRWRTIRATPPKMIAAVSEHFGRTAGSGWRG